MTEKLKQLIKDLGELCITKRAGLWLSGGKDSLLLLKILVAEHLPFDILCFEDGWTKEQKRVVGAIIDQHKIPVYSYLPRSMVLFGDGKNEITLACGYLVGANGEQVSLLKDFVPGARCAFDVNIEYSKRDTPPMLYGVNIWGTKKGESHYSFEGASFTTKPEWTVGEAHFAAPLFDWFDAEVIEALKLYGVDYREPTEQLNTGNIPACTNCLRENAAGETLCPKTDRFIPLVKWNPSEKLKTWQQLNRG